MEKYALTGKMQRGWFVDTDSVQVARGRVALFYGCTRDDGYPDRTMSAVLVAAADSIEELLESHPEAFSIDKAELYGMVRSAATREP